MLDFKEVELFFLGEGPLGKETQAEQQAAVFFRA